MKKYLRNSIFIVSSILFYLLWSNGGEQVYGKLVTTGIEKFTTKISAIESVEFNYYPDERNTLLTCKYADRSTNIAFEFCMPIVLLLAWHLSLFFDRRLPSKTAFRFFFINFAILYFLQILFPLLLYNISQSKMKSMGLFIGLQIFSFLVFFLILKDSLIIKYKFSEPSAKRLV